MNRQQAIELAPIITAFSEGQEVQFLGYTNQWVVAPSPSFSTDYTWRIKPDPQAKRDKWINEVCDLVEINGWCVEAGGQLMDLLKNHPDTPKEQP